MKYAKVGSVSSGTLREEDLLVVFANELERLVNVQNTSMWKASAGRARLRSYEKLIEEARDDDVDEDGVVELLVCDLVDALNEFSSEGCYFGAHPGDGADFGFWRVWGSYQR